MDYLALLAGAGCEVDAWETTYLHVLHGEDAVVDWYKGSGLRPVLAALPPAPAEEFLAEYRDRIRAAYPAGAVRDGAAVPARVRGGQGQGLNAGAEVRRRRAGTGRA